MICSGDRQSGSMPREIERKFLVAEDTWRKSVSREVTLHDGLLACANNRKIRIRLCDDRATLTVKGPRTGIGRDEFEFAIPARDAQALLQRHCLGEVLEKTRHYVPFGGFEWTVDEYRGVLSGVVLAEIELPSEETEFPKPPWLGREVTGLPEYRKINMVEAARRRNG
jgi:CYTH domain-containing protein